MNRGAVLQFYKYQWSNHSSLWKKIWCNLACNLGLYSSSSLRRHHLIGTGILIINLRRSSDRLRFIMGIDWWPSQVENGDSYTHETVSFQWIEALFYNSTNIMGRIPHETELKFVLISTKNRTWINPAFSILSWDNTSPTFLLGNQSHKALIVTWRSWNIRTVIEQ